VTEEALPETPGRGDTPDIDMPATVIEGSDAVPMEETGAQVAPTTESESVE
jgi:hypothetical protein